MHCMACGHLLWSKIGTTSHLQLQRNSNGSIQNNPKEKLTFSPGSITTSGSESTFSDEIEDADFSWVDRLGKWPKRIMWELVHLLWSKLAPMYLESSDFDSCYCWIRVWMPYSQACSLFLLSFSGFALALFAGLLYGFLFLPVAYLKLCDDNAHSCVGECVRYHFVECRDFSLPSHCHAPRHGLLVWCLLWHLASQHNLLHYLCHSKVQ